MQRDEVGKLRSALWRLAAGMLMGCLLFSLWTELGIKDWSLK